MTARLFEHQLALRWVDIAGSTIAAQTCPDQIRFRKLYLLVQSSVWLQQLVFLKPTLIEKLNAAAGSQVITDIILRIGDIGASRSVDNTADRAALAAGVRPDVTVTHVPSVKDPDLRDRLAALIASAPSTSTSLAPPTVSTPAGVL
jgi:hypothetical protein